VTTYSHRQRQVAVLYGLLCHSTFALGIASMIAGIYGGMAFGRGPFTGPRAWLANALLVAQFPVLHSFLLSTRGRRWLARLAPTGLGADLSTTIYATVASLQLLAVFVLWSPSGPVWWTVGGVPGAVLTVAYAGAWLLLMKTMTDAGLALQTGFLGWGAVARDRRPSYRPFPVRGTFALTRQPVYLAFSLTLWTAPVWTADRLALTLGWTAYCLLGPLLKERRYLRYYGAAYEAYRQSVPYWLPRLGRTPMRDHAVRRIDEPAT